MTGIYDNDKKVSNWELQQVYDRQGKKDVLFEIDPKTNSKIPNMVFVQCPANNMVKVQACNHCPSCACFKGFQDNGERKDYPDTEVNGWALRYFIICSAPMTRACEVIRL